MVYSKDDRRCSARKLCTWAKNHRLFFLSKLQARFCRQRHRRCLLVCKIEALRVWKFAFGSKIPLEQTEEASFWTSFSFFQCVIARGRAQFRILQSSMVKKITRVNFDSLQHQIQSWIVKWRDNITKLEYGRQHLLLPFKGLATIKSLFCQVCTYLLPT